ncbi:JAB domain-containing protein [Halomonas sp. DQ26W]|uniref:JAB domain-containing protein n=1 Tax=Halomonas sp. DQ26W TaxID=2282311 RepID=UPI003855A4B4
MKNPVYWKGLWSTLGDPEPNDNDRSVTQRLGEAQRLVEVRIMDRIVVESE